MKKNQYWCIKIMKKCHMHSSKAMTTAHDLALGSLQKCFLACGLTLEG